MIIKIETALRDARLNILVSALNDGYIELYAASQPANAGDAITDQILLSTHALSATVGTVFNGVLTFNPIADDVAVDDSGQPTWARFYDSTDGFVMDSDVGDLNSDALIKFDSVLFLQGGLAKITAGTLTEGNL